MWSVRLDDGSVSTGCVPVGWRKGTAVTPLTVALASELGGARARGLQGRQNRRKREKRRRENTACDGKDVERQQSVGVAAATVLAQQWGRRHPRSRIAGTFLGSCHL